MCNDLRDAAIGVFGLALFLGYANHRAEHAIVHDLRESVHGGVLHADVRPHGLLGLAIGRIDTVRVTGSGLSADDVPFSIHRGPGVRANCARLEFDLADLTLRGATVRRFTASFPQVSFDVARGLFDERIILRKAGEGTAAAEVTPPALVRFIEKKYPLLKQVSVDLRPGSVVVRGAMRIGAFSEQVEGTGRLVIREGRYLDLVEPVARLNGQPASAEFAQNLAKSVNPVVDFDRDLGLGRIFTAEEVEIGDGYATVRGRAHVPPFDPAEKIGKQEKK